MSDVSNDAALKNAFLMATTGECCFPMCFFRKGSFRINFILMYIRSQTITTAFGIIGPVLVTLKLITAMEELVFSFANYVAAYVKT